MFKQINYKFLSILFAALLISCAVLGLIFIKPAFTPSFYITGDVKEILKIGSMQGYETTTAQREDGAHQSLKLSDLIKKAAPYADEYTVVLKGDDALLAEVDDTEGMYITYTAQYAWECINLNHPPTSNIKRLTEIWVVSKKDVPEIAVNVITPDKNIASFTPGQFFMSERLLAPIFEGKSEKAAAGGKYNVTVYTQRQYQNIGDIAPDAKDALIMGDEGQYRFDSAPGRLELSGNMLQYVFSDGKTRMKNVRGILVNPPVSSNMDAYNESLSNIENNNKVLVFLIDGLGYHQFAQAKEKGFAPYMAARAKAKQASTVYMPVTHAGTAAILTGQPPFKNGVFARNMMDLKTPDIFEAVTAAGKKAAYIEGNIKILNTSVVPTLNADRNKDNSTDSEVFEAAMQAVQSGADYVFVHFHGVDDQGHSNGDLSQPVMDKIKEIDGYIAQLAGAFHGSVIITADHGMHAADMEGGHGLFRYEDMIVPYISFHL